MKIRYIPMHEGGQLQAFEATTEEAMALMERIWQFVCTHRHHVLRKYYMECKIADVFKSRNGFNEAKGTFNVLNFFSAWENHAPYVDILQRELNLEIEGLPA